MQALSHTNSAEPYTVLSRTRVAPPSQCWYRKAPRCQFDRGTESGYMFVLIPFSFPRRRGHWGLYFRVNDLAVRIWHRGHPQDPRSHLRKCSSEAPKIRGAERQTSCDVEREWRLKGEAYVTTSILACGWLYQSVTLIISHKLHCLLSFHVIWCYSCRCHATVFEEPISPQLPTHHLKTSWLHSQQ